MCRIQNVLEILSLKRQPDLFGNAYLFFSLLAFLKDQRVYEITTTIPIEKSPSSASQEIPCILWNLKVLYRIHNSSPLVPIPSLISTVHGSQPHFLNIHFILSSHLRLGLQVVSFPTVSKPKPVCNSPVVHTCYKPRPSHYS
jgi:hypothetical protein